MSSKKHMMGLLAAAAAVAVAGQSARAATQTTLYSTGFEAGDGFTAGAFITAQPNGSPNAFISQQGSVNVPQGTIQSYGSTFAGSTSTQQYALINAAGLTTTDFGQYAPNLPTFAPTAASNVVNIRVALAVTQGTNSPAFGISAISDLGANGVTVADFLVNGTTGAVTYNGNTTTPVATTTLQGLGASNFVSYQLSLDYTAQTYSIFSGVPGSNSFDTTIATNIPFENAATTFGSAALTALPLGNGTASGFGLFDNLSISSVPEPTTASLMVGAVALAGARRRRRVAR